jgi:hypothetical protein
MGDGAAVGRETLGGERTAARYPPSWVDRFTDWVDRLSGPSWMFYAGLWLVLYLIEIVTQWTGDLATVSHPFHIVFLGAIPLDLALIHYLDRTADAALSKFRPVMDWSDAEYLELRYRLTTMPARVTLLATLIGVAFAFFFLVTFPLEWRLRILHFADSSASIYYNSAISFVVWSCAAVLVYHTLHQLAVVSRIYGHARVNLFNLGSLYAFSDLSARTAIGILAIAYSWYVTVPEFVNQLISIVGGLFFSVVAIFTFIWPLLGVHNLLVEEKNRLLGETSKQLEAAITELHRRINSGQIQGMDDLNKAMASLEIEHAALNRISTWPWQAETVRWFIAALLFPVVVWLAQWILQRMLGA